MPIDRQNHLPKLGSPFVAPTAPAAAAPGSFGALDLPAAAATAAAAAITSRAFTSFAFKMLRMAACIGFSFLSLALLSRSDPESDSESEESELLLDDDELDEAAARFLFFVRFFFFFSFRSSLRDFFFFDFFDALDGCGSSFDVSAGDDTSNGAPPLCSWSEFFGRIWKAEEAPTNASFDWGAPEAANRSSSAVGGGGGAGMSPSASASLPAEAPYFSNAVCRSAIQSVS